MTDDTTEPLHVQALRRFANGRPMTDREQDIFNAGWQARGERAEAVVAAVSALVEESEQHGVDPRDGILTVPTREAGR